MNSLLLHRFGVRTSALCFALALVTVACTDDGGDEVGDEMSETMGDGDGDGDTTGDGDGDTTGDGDGDVALSYAADIQPIWDANCVTACHTPGGSAGTLLDLSTGDSAVMVGVASGQAPALSFVAAGSSADSYLVDKLRNTQVAAGGNGVQMPSGQDPLPEADIMTIEAWIDAGATP